MRPCGQSLPLWAAVFSKTSNEIGSNVFYIVQPIDRSSCIQNTCLNSQYSVLSCGKTEMRDARANIKEK